MQNILLSVWKQQMSAKTTKQTYIRVKKIFLFLFLCLWSLNAITQSFDMMTLDLLKFIISVLSYIKLNIIEFLRFNQWLSLIIWLLFWVPALNLIKFVLIYLIFKKWTVQGQKSSLCLFPLTPYILLKLLSWYEKSFVFLLYLKACILK